jgi:hypothetical protein
MRLIRGTGKINIGSRHYYYVSRGIFMILALHGNIPCDMRQERFTPEKS